MEKKLLDDWCECERDPVEDDEPIYMQNGICPCEVHKHHWHCSACLKITQVG